MSNQLLSSITIHILPLLNLITHILPITIIIIVTIIIPIFEVDSSSFTFSLLCYHYNYFSMLYSLSKIIKGSSISKNILIRGLIVYSRLFAYYRMHIPSFSIHTVFNDLHILTSIKVDCKINNFLYSPQSYSPFSFNSTLFSFLQVISLIISALNALTNVLLRC